MLGKKSMERVISSLMGALTFIALNVGFGFSGAHADWVQSSVPGQSLLMLSGRPDAIALAASARVLAITSKDPAGVTFVEPTAGQIITTVPLNAEPRAVALNSSGTIAYVVSKESGSILVIDVATAKVSATWPIGGSLSDAALKPDGSELVVADESGKRIVSLNPSSGEILRQLVLAHEPTQLAFAQNDLRLIVGSKQGHILVLDAGTWTTISQATLAEQIHALAWWPSGHAVLIVHKYTDGLSFVNPDTGAVSSTIGLDGAPQGVALGSNPEKGYVSTRDDFSVNSIDLWTPALEGRYNLPSNAGGLLYDPISKNIFVTQPKEGAVLRLDPAQNPLVSSLKLDRRVKDVKVDNKNHRAVAIAEKTNELFVMKLSNNSIASINIDARPRALAVDGPRNLAVIGAKGDQHKVYFVNLDTSAVYPETVEGEVRAIAVDETRGIAAALGESKGAVLFIDTRSRTLLGSLKASRPFRDLVIHSGTGAAYVISEDKGLSAIDLQTRTVVKDVSLSFKPRRIALDEKLNLVAITTEDGDKVQILDLATWQIVASHTLPKHPETIGIQPDTHILVIGSRESGQLSLVDLQSQTLTSGFYPMQKPSALGVSVRYNSAVVLSAEQDGMSIVPLPNPAPVLKELTPVEILSGSADFVLQATGEHFVDASKIVFGDQALTTRWLAPDKIEADVPAALLAAGRAVDVTVQTAAPGGGVSESRTFNVLNPAPVLTQVTPLLLQANKKDQFLTLDGAKFVPGAKVYFGAQELATTFISAAKLTAIVPGTLLASSGTVPVTVVNPAPGGGSSAAITVSVSGATPTITSFTPATGASGTAVTITGTNFDALNPGANDVRFGGERAVVSAANATQLVAIVPLRAVTGPISVTTQGGTATSATVFKVQTQQDFDIALAPAAIKIPLGGTGGTRVTLSSIGLGSYQQTTKISVTGLPPGVTYAANQANLYLGHDVVLNLNADATAMPGTYTVNVVATGPVDLQTLSRTKPLSVTILSAATTAVSGRVLHAENDSPFVNARIRLGSQETYTDATGSYRFVSPGLLGDQVLRIDGNTNATAQTQYPSAIAMPVMIEAGKDNTALTSYIQAVDVTKFTTITPGSETHVTDAEIPNYELRIPAGAVLMGWDGTPVTKVNVRTVPVDRLPIKPLPPEVNAKTVYLYYFFREGGANPSRPIPVTMNNDIGALPGDSVDLWYYDESITPDPNSNQWRIMGKGTVSQDGKSIVSDPGVGIPKFCCGATTASNPAPPPPPPTCPTAGNPVALSSGAATVLDSKPFGIQGGHFPVDMSCGYSSVNPVVGFFGIGTYFNYDWRVLRSSQAITAIAPNGERYNLTLEGDNVYRSREGRTNGIGMEATIAFDQVALRRQDGSVYEFSNAGFLIAQKDPNGNRITIARDTNNYATSLTDANGKIYTLDRTILQIGRTRYTLATQITDPLGRTQKYSYDTLARLTGVTDAAGNLTQYEYDAANRIVKKTDPRWAITQYVYDAAGRTVQEILPDGAVFRFDYTVAANTVTETRVTDPNGNVTTHRFNGQGYETRTLDALGGLTAKTIDYATNQLTSETDPAGRVIRYTYDGHGNRTSIVDPEGNTTIIEYDQQWNKPTRITNPLGFITTFAYDTRGNLIKTTNAEGEVTTLTYTPHGQLASIKDALGRVTTFQYDAEGNLSKTVDALGNARQSRYDAANRLIEQINPRGRSTLYSYDSLDRVTQAVDALGGKTQLSFDAQDNLLSVVDANAHSIETNVYDLRNRLTQKTDALGKAETYQYDANGNVVQVTARNSRSTQYQYDALNRISQISDADGRITQYTYDISGNVSRIADSVSGDIVLNYDRLNRLIQVSSNQGSVSYSYDALGRRIERRINGADATVYSYDKVNRLKSISYRGKSVSYSYDKAGQLIAKSLPNGINTQYQYDAAGRLTQLSHSKADGNALSSISYRYDENGNRIAQSRASLPDTPFTATYDAANRMLTYNGYALSYDANGNLIQRDTGQGPVTYSWDARNRLTQISGPNGTANFKYDALGRRIEKTVNGQTVQYLYDGDQAIAELSGSAIGATYLTGLQIDEVLARYSASGNRSLLTDALGSVIAQADDSTTIQTRYDYSPYGEVQVTGTDDGNPVQYTARENDATGLLYYRARYYDPQLKRFISEDPIGLDGGINVYAYVGGNPINYIDPEGLLLTALHSLQRGMSTQQATEASQVGNAGAVTALAIAGTAATATAAGRAAKMCYGAVEKNKDICNNAAMAAILGASICGNMSGTVKGSARSYPRDRERIEDVGNAATRAPRRNTGTDPR